jgi:hypothetical protein
MVRRHVQFCLTLTSTSLIDLDGEAIADDIQQTLGMVGWLDKIAQLRMELVLMQQIASDMNKSKCAFDYLPCLSCRCWFRRLRLLRR